MRQQTNFLPTADGSAKTSEGTTKKAATKATSVKRRGQENNSQESSYTKSQNCGTRTHS
jgi:hypothetical protein